MLIWISTAACSNGKNNVKKLNKNKQNNTIQRNSNMLPLNTYAHTEEETRKEKEIVSFRVWCVGARITATFLVFDEHLS